MVTSAPGNERPPPTAGAGTLSVRNAAHPATLAPPADEPVRRPRRRAPGVVAVVTVAAVAAAVLAPVHPSGNGVADRVLAAGFVALVAAAGSSARRWTWYVAAGVSLAAGGDRIALFAGVAALALAVVSTGPIRPHASVGAAVGGLSALALTRAHDVDVLGVTAAVTAVAVAPMVISGYRNASRRTRRGARRLVLAGAAVLVLVGGAYGLALRSARPAAERGLEQLDRGLAAARAGDDAAARDHLDSAATAFAEAEDDLAGWLTAPARVVPVVGHNARATAALAASAADVAREGADAATDADTDALTVQDGRLDLAHVASLQAPLGDVAGTLETAATRLDGAGSPWLLPPVADRLERVEDELADARPDVDLAADATRLLPAMFGGEGQPTRWLVAFVTPVEARGRTGFMGNFAELTAVDGKVDMTRFGRAGELESGGTPGPQRTLTGPDDYLARWARFAPAATWRNVTMAPDFPSVGQVMAELYPQSGGQPVDGVIAVDPVGLAALLTFTGPITVPDVDAPLTADTAADYLLRQQYLLGDNAARVDALESLSRQTFERLTTGDLPGPRTVADTLGEAAAGGHLHAYAVDPEQQALFRDVGVDGALPAVGDGDFLGVVNNNAVGNKIDLYLTRQIAYTATWDPDTGEVDATATVTLRNDAPASGLPGYVIGSPIAGADRPGSGTNRTYLSVYTPWELDTALVDGQPVAIERQIETGRYAYSAFLDVPPRGGTRSLELQLSGRVPAGDTYDLAVTTQPLVVPDQLTLTVEAAGPRPDGVTASPPLVVDGRTATSAGPLVEEQNAYRVEAEP